MMETTPNSQLQAITDNNQSLFKQNTLLYSNLPPILQSNSFQTVAKMGSYINSTDANPWDQMIVLSQKVINDSFQNMWQLAQLDDAASPLKHFERVTRGGEYLKMDIGVPSVQLQTIPKDQLLYFMLRMSSGSCFIYLSEDANDDSHIDWEINDWVFAFSVSIATRDVAKDSAEYQDFKNRSGLLNWDFSLARLFIDASSTTKFAPELSTFGDRQADYDRLSSARAKGIFNSFVQDWLNIMQTSGCNTLGYSARASADTSDDYQPTFPPTSIDYDTYPWKVTPDSTNQDNIDRNALCYLMMCNYATPAVDAVSYTGQWVDDNHGATYSLNRSLFWPWMFTVLRDVVISTIPVPDTPTLYWDNTDKDHPYASRMEYHFGDRTATNNDYKFVSAGPGKWSWAGRPLTSSKQVYNPGNSNDSETIVESVNYGGGSGGILSFNAGQEQISLTGKSTFILRVDHDSKRDTYTQMVFTLTWTIAIAMAAVENGGVVFKVTNHAVGTQSSSEGNLSWAETEEVVAAKFASQMSNSLSNAVSRAENDLMNALANQHRLFLPAKGHFLMKDPVFNSRGDLLVGLTYNGATPPKPPASK
ncbi:hypothetical protein V8C42DRAFT_314890 [Trichoderma barbatum]